MERSIFNSPVFKAYFLQACFLMGKMLLMSPLTSFYRMRYKAFANFEDAAINNVKPRVDENIERIRRAHLNDIENIPIFLTSGFIYSLTNPPLPTAKLLFKVFAISRLLHTIVYALYPLPQPSRFLAYFVGYSITSYMIIISIIYFLQ